MCVSTTGSEISTRGIKTLLSGRGLTGRHRVVARARLCVAARRPAGVSGLNSSRRHANFATPHHHRSGSTAHVATRRASARGSVFVD